MSPVPSSSLFRSCLNLFLALVVLTGFHGFAPAQPTRITVQAAKRKQVFDGLGVGAMNFRVATLPRQSQMPA